MSTYPAGSGENMEASFPVSRYPARGRSRDIRRFACPVVNAIAVITDE